MVTILAVLKNKSKNIVRVNERVKDKFEGRELKSEQSEFAQIVAQIWPLIISIGKLYKMPLTVYLISIRDLYRVYQKS